MIDLSGTVLAMGICARHTLSSFFQIPSPIQPPQCEGEFGTHLPA